MTIKLNVQTGEGAKPALPTPHCSLNDKLPPFRVLIVEDMEPLAELMRRALEYVGCRVQIAHTQAAGQQMLSSPKTPPDLVLLDIDLPDGNGFDLCAWLRQQPLLGDVPVVFCTGRAGPETTTKAMALNAKTMFKPFSMEALVELVEQHRRLGRSPAGL